MSHRVELLLGLSVVILTLPFCMYAFFLEGWAYLPAWISWLSCIGVTFICWMEK